jgi:argininosuccinate lyase
MDPWKSLMRRRSQGSPNPEEVERMLRERRDKLRDYERRLSERRAAMESSKKNLMETVENYIGKE